MATEATRTPAQRFSQALIDCGLLPPRTISYAIECGGRREQLKITASYLAEPGNVAEFCRVLPMQLNESAESEGQEVTGEP